MKVFLKIFLFLFPLYIIHSQEIVTLENQNLPEGIVKIEYRKIQFSKKGKLKSHYLVTDTYSKYGGLLKRTSTSMDRNLKTKSDELEYTYNNEGQLVKLSNKDQANYYTFTYDAKGNLTTSKETGGRKMYVKYEYDFKNRKIKSEHYLGNILDKITEYTYDRNVMEATSKHYDGKGEFNYRSASLSKNNLDYVILTERPGRKKLYEFFSYDSNDYMTSYKQGSKEDQSDSFSVIENRYKYNDNRTWVIKYKNFPGWSDTFEFRKIYYANGSTSGSTSIDKSFIAKHVDISKIAYFQTNTKPITKKPKRPTFKDIVFPFTYIKYDNQTVNSSGTIRVIAGNGLLDINNTSNAIIIIKINGKRNSEKVKIISKTEDSNSYSWNFEGYFSDTKFKLVFLKRESNFKGKRILAYLYMTFDGSTDKYLLE